MNRGQLNSALERQRETNQPIEPMNILQNLISTQKGWIIRQVLKYAAQGGAMLTATLVSHGVAISDPQAITAALSTLAVGLIEVGLSKMASPISTK